MLLERSGNESLIKTIKDLGAIEGALIDRGIHIGEPSGILKDAGLIYAILKLLRALKIFIWLWPLA
eukprot:TRINITY_DN3870_c0_g1_i1.p2 TRINITY_DN3870_c0_g1~~TRINITY_DN3870_c0_g1_i1.p2  ORF type:complete len:66 (+),score=5.52 TRINITY_DN3870_c0_g1_i1:274-471(+)